MSLTDGRPAFSTRQTRPTESSTGRRPVDPALGAPRPPSGYAPFDAAASVYGQYGSPQLTILQNQANQLGTQIGYQNYGYGLQTGALNTQYGYDQAQNALAQQALGIDGAAIGRQTGYYNNLYGIDREKYQNAIGYQGKLKGFSGEDYRTTLQGLAGQASQARFNADRDVRRLLSGQTAAGAYTSEGSREGRTDINTDRDYALGAIDVNRRQANIGYRKDLAGIDNTIANLTSDFKAAGLTKDEQIARLGDRRQQLDIQSQQLGIQSDELSSRLEQGLASLNLNHVSSVGQIMDALSSNNQQQIQWAMNVMQQALGAAGLMGG